MPTWTPKKKHIQTELEIVDDTFVAPPPLETDRKNEMKDGKAKDSKSHFSKSSDKEHKQKDKGKEIPEPIKKPSVITSSTGFMDAIFSSMIHVFSCISCILIFLSRQSGFTSQVIKCRRLCKVVLKGS